MSHATRKRTTMSASWAMSCQSICPRNNAAITVRSTRRARNHGSWKGGWTESDRTLTVLVGFYRTPGHNSNRSYHEGVVRRREHNEMQTEFRIRGEFLRLLHTTGVYAVTDDALRPEELLQTVDALLTGGVRLFQFRDKRRSDRDRVSIASAIADRVHAQGGLMLVNDRADLAVAAGADGAHVGQDDLPAPAARALLGPSRVLGVSASYLPEIGPAEEAGADYIGFGAIFRTDTKADAEHAGLDLLSEACRQARIPVVAIGGITEARIADVIRRGADGVAAVSALFRTDDAAQAAAALLDAVARSRSAEIAESVRRRPKGSPLPFQG
ncbi:MAG: thiamine phosphate synthase [Chloroflexi bacterium]|nr:thiamine phosphate synthase [Chloroflexota bacterium]